MPLHLGPADVLIVDADEPFRKSLYRVIRRAGYRVAVARDETEALQKTARNHFPLIVIDLWQASRAAVNLVQQVRSASPLSQIMVITPFEASEFCAELEGLEIFECVRKPVKRSVLLDVVSRALSGAKKSERQ